MMMMTLRHHLLFEATFQPILFNNLSLTDLLNVFRLRFAKSALARLPVVGLKMKLERDGQLIKSRVLDSTPNAGWVIWLATDSAPREMRCAPNVSPQQGTSSMISLLLPRLKLLSEWRDVQQAVIRSLSNHDDNGNKNPTNLHIWQWKTLFLHALHVQFSSFDILKTFSFFLRREMTCFVVVWTTRTYDDNCSILSSYVPSAGSNLIARQLEHIFQA